MLLLAWVGCVGVYCVVKVISSTLEQSKRWPAHNHSHIQVTLVTLWSHSAHSNPVKYSSQIPTREQHTLYMQFNSSQIFHVFIKKSLFCLWVLKEETVVCIHIQDQSHRPMQWSMCCHQLNTGHWTTHVRQSEGGVALYNLIRSSITSQSAHTDQCVQITISTRWPNDRFLQKCVQIYP